MYNFFIGDGVQMPVAPSEMSLKINNKNEAITLMNEGEVNILKLPGLSEIEFEILLPNVQYPFAVYPEGFKPAAYYLKILKDLKKGKKPFQFVVTRMLPSGKLLFDTNITVSLESYEIKESADYGSDLMVAINLKEYREFKTKTVKLLDGPKGRKQMSVIEQRPTTGKQTPKTHTVKSGDTLWAIAKKYLGNGSKYTELAKLNKISNPNIIKVGQVIKLG